MTPPTVLRLTSAALRFWQGRHERRPRTTGAGRRSSRRPGCAARRVARARWRCAWAAVARRRSLDAGRPASTSGRPRFCALARRHRRFGTRRTSGGQRARRADGAPYGPRIHLFARRSPPRRFSASAGGTRPMHARPGRCRGGGGPLDRLVYWQLRLAARNECRDIVTREIWRAGAHGVARWGQGTRRMPLLHGLSAVVELVQEADDGLAALVGSCAWMRREAGAKAVAFFDTAGALIARDGPIGVVEREMLSRARRRAGRRASAGRRRVRGRRARAVRGRRRRHRSSRAGRPRAPKA